jgi:N-acetylglucosamine kinase-like BadF-type ATPase
MMAAIYLGVDTGATKSEALIANDQGHVLGYGRSGPGNWENVGWHGARSVLQTIIQQALEATGATIAEISASGLGLAGYDWPEDHAPHMVMLREIGLKGSITLVNDAVPGLIAGAPAGWGVVISAGTSCNSYGRNAQGRYGRMTGDSRFGEYAGASELVQYALQAVSRAWSMRGPQTRLGRSFVEAAGAKDVDDLLAGLVRGRYHVHAGHARLVFETAAAGDGVAREAVDWAGRQLGDLGLGVIRQLDLAGQAFDVVLSGSLYRGSPRLQTCIRDVITAEAPGARIRRLTVPPVTGGVLLAMEADGLETASLHPALLQSIAGVIEP